MYNKVNIDPSSSYSCCYVTAQATSKAVSKLHEQNEDIKDK